MKVATLEQALSDAAALTLESLCMMYPDDIRELEQRGDLRGRAVEVEFDGPFVGRMHVVASEDAISEAACNMLAAEGEVDDELALDVLREVSNIVCGQFLPSLQGETAVFDIGAPKLVSMDELAREHEISIPIARVAIECLDGNFEFAVLVGPNGERAIREAHA